MGQYIYLISFQFLFTMPRNIVSSIPSSIDGIHDKIVGGYFVTIEDFPYQVALFASNGMSETPAFQCGGSIISEQYILTAAHCVIGVLYMTARIGSTDLDEGGNLYESISLRSHPFYNPITHDYDVGYVRMPVMYLDGITSWPVDLPEVDSPVESGTILTVTGWGTTAENGSDSYTLKAVDVPVKPDLECQNDYNELIFTSRMICAGYDEGGEDHCRGDSGGAAVTDDGIQRGIVSYSKGCAEPNFPGVYTNVSSVREWIQENTGV